MPEEENHRLRPIRAIRVTNDTILRGPRRFLVATPSRQQTLPANSTWREASHL